MRRLNFHATVKLLTITFVFLCLAACGFQLQRQPLLPAYLKTIYLQSADPYGQFETLLKRSLQLAGATVVNNPAQAPIILTVLNKNFSSVYVSIGASSQTRVYNLTYWVAYTLTDSHNKTLLLPQALSASNNVTYNANQLPDSNDQQKQAIVLLQHNIIQQLIARLNSQQMQKIIGQTPSISPLAGHS